MARWLAPLSFLALLSTASDAAASKVAADLTLARRGNPFLTTDGGRSVVVRFTSPEAAARAAADLRREGITLATTPMVTGAFVATADGDALDVLARHPDVLRIEAAAPTLRPLDRDVIEGTGVGDAFRAALGASGHWLDGSGLTIADVDSDVFVFHPSLFRADAGAFAWIDVDGNGVFEPGVDAIDLDRDGNASPGEVARLLSMEMRSLTFARLEPSDTFEATRDYVYLDTNGNQRRDFGDGFAEDTPAFGEPLFVPDDVNGNGKLDAGERLLRLGSTKLAKVRALGQVYERGKAKGILAYGKKVLANLDGARVPEHGTYMTSIMAGGNGSNRYRGIAPGADLVVVTEPDLPALDWLAREPSVVAVAMPIGSWFSPLDGSSELEGMVDALWKRGVFTSVSVGNSGTGGGHAVVTLDPSVETEISIAGALASTDAYLNVLTRAPGAALDVVLVDPEGAPLSSGAAGETSARGTTSKMAWTRRVPTSGKLRVRITMRGASAPAPVHVFATGGFGEELRIERGASRETTLGSPATADTSVGGTGWVVHSGKDYGATDPVGALASFSSRGPRIDGRNLVGLAGPVNPIAATIVKDAPEKMAVRAWAGTSCVSPQLAAAAALLKQHDPSLDAGAIRDKLLASARREDGADANAWGAGKLDVRAAIGLPAISKTPPAIAITVVAGTPRKLRVATEEGARLRARWDFDYDGTWDTEWQPLADVDAPASGDVRVSVHDEAGNVVGAVVTVPPAMAPEVARPDEGDSGCTVSSPAPSTSRRWSALLLAALLSLATWRRRRVG